MVKDPPTRGLVCAGLRACLQLPKPEYGREFHPEMTAGKAFSIFTSAFRAKRRLFNCRTNEDQMWGIFVVVPAFHKILRQGKPGVVGETLDRLGERKPFGLHHKIENIAVF